MGRDSHSPELNLRTAAKLDGRIGAMAAAAIESQEAKRRDELDAETIAIAKEANRLAVEAYTIARSEAAAAARSARYSMYAALIAAVSAVFSAKEQIHALIFGAP